MGTNKTILLSIKYDLVLRFVAILFRLLAIFLGCSLLVYIENYFVNFFGILITIFFLYDFINTITFEELIFFDDKIVKKSSLLNRRHSKSLKYSEIEAMSVKHFFGGTFTFYKKGNRLRSIWFFNFDLLPIKNIEFQRIKQILTEKKVIKGDENGWNY